jgi:hypothetical protein
VEGQIRPFIEDDIPRVAALHNKVWRVAPDLTPELIKEYRDYFTQAFLRHPVEDSSTSSLVHEESDGRITGFMGSMPRKMLMNKASIRMRVASQFFVDPGSRGLAGIQLAKAFMDGPQDVSFTDEANATARLIWERLGGSVCSFSSLRWIAVLRPCRFGLLALRKFGLPGAAARGLTPFAHLLDSLVSRLPKNPIRPVESRLVGEELESGTLVDCLREVSQRRVLRPEYDECTVAWLLQRAGQLKSSGRLRKVLVRTRSGDIAGSYVYYANPGGLSEVVQLTARSNLAHDVVESLFHDAWQEGASVLIGRPQVNLMRALSDKHCFFYSSRRQWMLVQSRNPDLVNTFVRGDAFLSRLEGEWCLHFR